MRNVLCPVDHFSSFVLHFLDYLFDLVLCLTYLLFGLRGLTIGFTFGVKVLVACQTPPIASFPRPSTCSIFPAMVDHPS